MILMLFYFHWSFHLWIMIFCWCFPTSNWKYFLLEFRVWDFFKKFKLKNIEDKRTLLTWYIHEFVWIKVTLKKKKKSLHTRLFWIYFSFILFFLLKSYRYWLQRRKSFQFFLLKCMHGSSKPYYDSHSSSSFIF